MTAAGADVHRRAREDLDSLDDGAAAADGVIHLAFKRKPPIAELPTMGLAGHGSNRDLADGLHRVAERIGLLGISRSPVPPVGPTIEPSRRGFGSITVAVATVLGSAGEMQTRDVHRAIEGLLGESVSFSSVKNCLARKSVGNGLQFERVSRGRYRLTQ